MVGVESLLGARLGTCRLDRLIGQGGMGAVFLAQQERPHRQVAVKVLLPSVLLDSTQHHVFLARFRREADAIASLDHTNILPLFEYGEQEGLAYLVMPFVSGGTLRDQIVFIRQGQPLALFQIASCLDQAAAALEYAHHHGVIHRDVKPANFLLHPDGRLLLSDFGIARLANPEPEQQFSEALSFSDASSGGVSLTQTGVLMGTPAYIAPEQLRGGQLDGRADLYSLGAMTYELLTGVAPFVAETSILLAAKHLAEPPPPLLPLRPDLPEAAEQAVLRALAKAPEDRFQHAPDFSGAFRAALVAAGVPDRKQSLPLVAPLQSRRTTADNQELRSAAPGIAQTPASSGWVTPPLPSAGTPEGVELAPTAQLALGKLDASGAAMQSSAASRSEPLSRHTSSHPSSGLEAQATHILTPAPQGDTSGKPLALPVGANDRFSWTGALIAGLALGLASIITTMLHARDLWVWWALFAVVVLLSALKQHNGSRSTATGEAALVAVISFGAGVLLTFFSGAGRDVGEGVLVRVFLVFAAVLLAAFAAWLARICFFPLAHPPSFLRLFGGALLFGALALVVAVLLASGNTFFALRKDAPFDIRFQRALLYFLAHLLIAPGAYLRVLNPHPFVEFVGWALAVTLMGIAIGAAVSIGRDRWKIPTGSISRAISTTSVMQFSYLLVGLLGLNLLADDPKLLRALQADASVSLVQAALPIVVLLPLVALFFSILGTLWFQQPAGD